MANWIPTTKMTLDDIEKIYGITGLSIGLSYHALAYLELIIGGNTNYIAIETTICQPYKLQFYIGTNNQEFENIIKTRYQCSDFNVSFECDKNWWEISLPRGGTKQKMKRKNKTKIKNKKRKQKKSVNKCIIKY